VVNLTSRATKPDRGGTLAAVRSIANRYPQLTLATAALAGVFVLAPALTNPLYPFALLAVLIATWIAWRSLVIPLAVGGVPPLVDAIVGHDPLPSGAFTFIFSVWIVMAIGFAILRGREGVAIRTLLCVPVLASCFLLGLMLLRVGTSPDEVYGSTKLQLYIADVLIFLFAAVFVGARGATLRRFFMVTLAITSAGALLFLFNLVSGGAHATVGGRFSLAAQEYPIELGRDSGDGLLVAVYAILAATSTRARNWGLAVTPVLAVALIAAGSRGPVVAFVFGLLALVALSATSRRARRRLALVAVAGLAATIVVPLVVPGSALGRALSVIIGSASGLSSNGRSQLWSVAIASFSAHPLLGLGWGGFGTLVPGQGIVYPHNILLEVGTELGLVGAVALVSIVLGFIVRLARLWRSTVGQDQLAAALLIALFLTALINACFSGAIQDNREVWLWGGLALGMSGRIAAQPAAVTHKAAPIP
jgi:O-antigen ligase